MDQSLDKSVDNIRQLTDKLNNAIAEAERSGISIEIEIQDARRHDGKGQRIIRVRMFRAISWKEI